ncbi:glycerophosphoryl diester phosphodiesterase membrane domain-containing protein [Marinifilum sp. D714]|uniref:glycerophosphoryl diester phosphodiesterase membrane domain-containing protein n=1 Tax=Marinifilum sp. D714 TaxID=2937523 RepID=UPI0027CD417C|nr:glycerophosphoryl diester phosphodiesterase membrane domain-containing protein [Marinifilum sp. D714]MDQ2178902.1 glycerophosphoryl diester phosphodiesterase membrane domain-containing protein [Marinifilum sp. D714]
MTTENFRLEKVRDFGLLFSDTFLFIKYNFKNLSKGMLYYVLPFSLLYGILFGLFQYRVLIPQQDNNPFLTNYTEIAGIIVGMMIMMLLTYTITISFSLEYIKLYREKGSNNFELNEVRKAILGNIGKIFGAMILCGILMTLGFVVVLIPGIYLSICLSLVMPIIVFENESIGNALSGCFNLIKNNWWNAFAFLFVISIICYIFNLTFKLPSGIHTLIIEYLTNTGDNITPSKSVTIIFSIIQTIGYAFVQLIPMIAISILYFNLIERKQSPALLKDLETVGNNETSISK